MKKTLTLTVNRFYTSLEIYLADYLFTVAKEAGYTHIGFHEDGNEEMYDEYRINTVLKNSKKWVEEDRNKPSDVDPTYDANDELPF